MVSSDWIKYPREKGLIWIRVGEAWRAHLRLDLGLHHWEDGLAAHAHGKAQS